MVVLTSELFGSLHLASNYMFFDGGSAAVGTLMFANLLPRLWDETHGGSNCIGASCYGWTHLIIIGVNGSGVVAALVGACRSLALVCAGMRIRV